MENLWGVRRRSSTNITASTAARSSNMTPIELVASREDLIAATLDVQYNVKIDNQYLEDGTELYFSSPKNLGVTNSHTTVEL